MVRYVDGIAVRPPNPPRPQLSMCKPPRNACTSEECTDESEQARGVMVLAALPHNSRFNRVMAQF
ncbi:hypothetical protein CONLIGDRAFT_185025 [Coniochaeta ligniaria NRRL 30616]|uniref:Uncharacterized protein n=1 Tax=Coniochaeta ligniaria NRRL 30616 TaxID=1408157 RepID=A0A1J7J2A6_9PEZI|nr:hypothetical protein CONLIGDRAFT_185025 [Coniochaeta ligniaria NRRL 30616]